MQRPSWLVIVIAGSGRPRSTVLRFDERFTGEAVASVEFVDAKGGRTAGTLVDNAFVVDVAAAGLGLTGGKLVARGAEGQVLFAQRY